jgi:hypothetical protein
MRGFFLVCCVIPNFGHKDTCILESWKTILDIKHHEFNQIGEIALGKVGPLWYSMPNGYAFSTACRDRMLREMDRVRAGRTLSRSLKALAWVLYAAHQFLKLLLRKLAQNYSSLSKRVVAGALGQRKVPEIVPKVFKFKCGQSVRGICRAPTMNPVPVD